MEKAEKGEGSFGKLMNDDSLYVHLDASSKNLSLLLEDMKSNPKRYVQFSVFGKKDK
jgi:phospholipid/cholesterol/gamma-HCH transport system substrate-binding protein